MIINFLSRYFKFICAFMAFSAGWYSGYTYYNVRQLKIDLNAKSELIKGKDLIISKMEIAAKITDNILAKSAALRQQEKTNYENVYSKLQNMSKQLDATNYINSILVRTVKAGVNGKTMPDANTASGINEEATTYRATDFARGVIKFGENCTENTNQLMLLQEWNLKQYESGK